MATQNDLDVLQSDERDEGSFKNKIDDALNEADEILNEKITDSNEDLQKIKKSYAKLETVIKMKSHYDDVQQAIYRIKSGKIILKAKKSCKYGSWEVFAINNFDISIEERKIRQKVASIKNIDKYTYLGWKRIKELARAIKKYTFTDQIDNIIKSINYKLDLTKSNDIETFKVVIDSYIINEKLLKQKNINIKLEHIVDAVECGLEFTDKIVKKLSKSKNATVSLHDLIDFETTDVNNSNNNQNRTRELPMILEKLINLANESIDKNESMKYIEGYLLEDAAHYIGKLFDKKCEEEGIDRSKLL